MLDLEKMLVPVSGDHPAGTLEEYNQLYLQLDELAMGKPASTMGDSIIEGTDPDWYGLRDACLKLWETTRDLRVAIYLCIAEFSIEGLKGFSDALAVLEYLVEKHWEDFYPLLDADDDNDLAAAPILQRSHDVHQQVQNAQADRREEVHAPGSPDRQRRAGCQRRKGRSGSVPGGNEVRPGR